MVERRRAKRYRIKVVVDKIEGKSITLLLDYDKGDGYIYDFEGDISEKGLFIATENPFPKGEEVEVFFSFPESIDVIKARGKVAWVGEGGPEKKMGMGIEIIEIDKDGKEEINRFLKKAEVKNAG